MALHCLVFGGIPENIEPICMDISSISLAEYLEKKKAALAKKMEGSKENVQAELLEFLVALGMESERSAVVLGAERVHVAVQGLVGAFLRPSKNKKDEIFRAQGALASFSKKIEMAYRLGLMDLRMRQAVDMVRDLRNDFAHATKVERLTDQNHSDRVKALWTLMKAGNEVLLIDFAESFQNAAKEVGSELSEQNACFLSCIMQLLVKLEVARLYVEPPFVVVPAKLDFDDPD